MKIAEFVRQSFQRLSQKDLLSSEEIFRLTDEKYSKDVFNIIYPVLKEHREGVPKSEQINIKGKGNGLVKPRYLAKQTYQFKGKRYYLCNHWIEVQSRSYFTKWLNKIE